MVFSEKAAGLVSLCSLFYGLNDRLLENNYLLLAFIQQSSLAYLSTLHHHWEVRGLSYVYIL